MVTTVRKIPTPPLLEPGAPRWAVRAFSRLNEFFKLRHPQAPSELYLVKLADLPPAPLWTGALVWVTDVGKVGVSNGVAWVQTDGGVL